MHDLEQIILRIKDSSATWDDYDKIIKTDSSQLESVFIQAYNTKILNFGSKLKIYIPGRNFPAISITGNECSLNCEHCNKKYLDGMIKILDPGSLQDFLINLSNDGGTGALISGGSDINGVVPIEDFLDDIREVKEKTQLIINAHTGLLDEKTAKKLTDSHVDIISFDVNMDEEIIKDIYHLDKDINDYKIAVENLKKHDLNIVPHICIGLYYGNIHKELDSIKFIKEVIVNPSLIVVIALIPPKNSKIPFKSPKAKEIAKVIALLRLLFPKTEISLGCMRPRGNLKFEIEKLAINAGITRIEIPSKKTLEWIKKNDPNVSFEFFSACCAIPAKFEELARSKKKDLKGYKKFV
jgi:uncharacterized radical SAM superfamily protein